MAVSYNSPEAFRQAIDARLMSKAKGSSHSLDRLRQMLVFNRFLVRLAAEFGSEMLVKGGVVMELRVPVSRMTRDVDILVRDKDERIAQRMERACLLDVGDFMEFNVQQVLQVSSAEFRRGQTKVHRFRAECKVSDRRFGWPFGVDVATGDAVAGIAEEITAPDLLAFIGIPPPCVLIFPVTTHIAEKLHAYTQPRAGKNSRVRDLPDVGLLAAHYSISKTELRAALDATFGSRGTHGLPEALPNPPEFWAAAYATMAVQDSLPWCDLAMLFDSVSDFLTPVLDGTALGTWSWESM